MIAVRALVSNSNALLAPETANSDRPAASSVISTHVGTCETGVKITNAIAAPTSAATM